MAVINFSSASSRGYKFSYRLTVIINFSSLAWLLLARHVQAPSSWTAFARYSFGLIVAWSPCLSSFKLNGLCTIFLQPCGCAPSRRYWFTNCLTAIIDFFFRLHGNLRLTAMSTFSSPHGDDQLLPCLTAVSRPHGNSSGSHPHHSFLRLTAIHLSRWYHHWFCISGQYHHQFGLTQAISSSIWPHPGNIIIDSASPPCPSGR